MAGLPGGYGGPMEAAVMDAQWERKAACRDKGSKGGWCSLKAHEPHSPLDYDRDGCRLRGRAHSSKGAAVATQRRLAEAKRTRDAP